MDPVNRRTCWKLIQKLKKNRLIVVTTHLMLEADVLGDQVGIMAHGKLECKGTPLAIKNEYGDGYTLSVVLKDGKDQEMMLTKGLNRVLATEGSKGKVNTSPELCITQRDGKAIKFTVPHQEVYRLPIVLRYLERIEGTIVAEWGVSDATLESAFLNATEKSGFTYQSTQKKNRNRNIETKENTELLMKDQERKYSSFSSSSSSAMNNSSASSSSSSSSSWQSFTALLKKNFLLQSRQRCSSCCQIITPILVVSFNPTTQYH
jgi:ABC-type multidrug transport system ATPase subunit